MKYFHTLDTGMCIHMVMQDSSCTKSLKAEVTHMTLLIRMGFHMTLKIWYSEWGERAQTTAEHGFVSYGNKDTFRSYKPQNNDFIFF